MPASFNKKEVANILGIPERTVQYYAGINLTTRKEKKRGKVILYSFEDIIRLQVVILLKEDGYSIKTIKKIFKQYYLDSIALRKKTGWIIVHLKELKKLATMLNSTSVKIES